MKGGEGRGEGGPIFPQGGLKTNSMHTVYTVFKIK